MVPAEVTESVQALPGVGPRRAKLFARIGVNTVADLLYLLPLRYEDRSTIRTLIEAVQNEEGLVHVRVIAHDHFPRGHKKVLKIRIADESASAELVCFGRNFLNRTFPVGSDLLVFGRFTYRYGEIQSSVFDARKSEGEPRPEGFLPIYPLTEGLSQGHVRNAVTGALKKYGPLLTDPLPDDIRIAEGFPSIGEALQSVHRPRREEEIEPALQRLRFEELFYYQLAITRRTLAVRRETRRIRPERTRRLMEAVRNALPFSLTGDQETVLQEITSDLAKPSPMNRLLHGDVGSGKTLVALLAAVYTIERGEQAALMVPTELLARQHAWNASRILAPAGVTVALVLGGIRAPVKHALTEAVSAGAVDLIIGTHALFSRDMVYANLGLVIIDEQHRFGVDQRDAIISRGTTPDLLLMSATPIPRSLALTAFGESDISTITTLPPGRKAVETHLVRMGNERRVYEFVGRELDAGKQAYFVYPAIDEGSVRDLRSATKMAKFLENRFPGYTTGLVHSRMDADERAATMKRFKDGDVHVLVATSVVEVGVDVPDATCMVIEHAELFGLAALHQLRGRVGRGNAQAYCILVYQDPLTVDAKERLRVLYKSHDGFFIAEEDLRIRGPGDLLGTRQAGFLPLRIADIRRDMELMIKGRSHIAALLRDDPDLRSPRNRAVDDTLRAVTAVREREEGDATYVDTSSMSATRKAPE